MVTIISSSVSPLLLIFTVFFCRRSTTTTTFAFVGDGRTFETRLAQTPIRGSCCAISRCKRRKDLKEDQHFDIFRSIVFLRNQQHDDDGDDEEEKHLNSSSKANKKRDSEAAIVTKEMFMREMLSSPYDDDDDDNQGGRENNEDATAMVSKKKDNKKNKTSKKGKQRNYKAYDNRDALPFGVQVATPDPYTHPDQKKKKAAKVPKNPSAVEQNIISSSLFINNNKSSKKKKNNNKNGDSNNDDDDKTWLGEYRLDKHTTTGDLLLIGDTEYKVVQHKCQYKYAGGKQFVMVRKILQVKEVGRHRTEEYLKRQLKQSEDSEHISSNTGGNEFH